jgi:segregation and condensation protein B
MAQLDAIKASIEANVGGFMLEQTAGGYRFATRAEHEAVLKKYFARKGESRLSIAALETLAIVAYRQPVTAPELSDIRGVNSTGVLRTLLERRLIRVSGRKNVVGSPFLYRTTREFLIHFGLNDIRDLPRLEEFGDLVGETISDDLVRGVRERIYPVGRLDFHSEGLVLLTNDGELAYKVSHPTSGSVKTYNVKVRGVPEERLVEKLRRGITIEGKRTLPCDIERIKTTGKKDDEGNSWLEVRLREGRTQQIRKMFKAVGHPVAKLKRVAIGPIADPKLSAGDWRELTKTEVKMLETMKEPAKVRRAARRVTTRKKPATKSKPRRTPTRRG